MLIQSTSLLLVGIEAQALAGQPDLMISAVNTVLEAADHLARHGPQILMIDAEWMEAFQRLEAASVPIIAVVSDEALGEQTVWHGAQAYIAREDLNPRTLRYVIRHVLERLMLQNTLHKLADQTLEHEMRLRSLIARNADGMVVVDRSEITRFVNPAAEVLFASKEGTMIGQRFSLPLSTGEATQYAIRRPTGAIVHVEMRVIDIEWMGKAAFLVSLHDVSERFRMEQRLIDAAYENSIFATAINHLAIGVLITSPQGPDHPLVYVNPAFTAITGYLPEDVMGKDPRFLQGTETDTILLTEMDEAIAHDSAYENVVLNYRKDGTPFWNKLSIVPVMDADGVLKNWVGLLTDFTPIIEAELELKHERDFTSAIIDTAGSLIVVADAQGNVVRVNPAYEEVTGFRLEEIDKGMIWELMFQGDPEKIVSVLSEGQPFEPVLGAHVGVMMTRDSRMLKILWRSTALRNAAREIEYIIITGLDITEQDRAAEALVEKEKLRVALEQERELNELKSRFVSMFSHELRTPLSTISLATDMLKNYRHRFSEADITTRLNQIQAQVMHLTSLMDDMLTISRAETVGLDFHPVLTNMETFCHEVVEEILEGNLYQHTIEVDVHGDSEGVLIDPKLMRQVLLNLLTNAMKYSPANTRVDLVLECTERMMSLRVSDHGRGIPPADLKRLFQTFQRASNVDNIPGTGIGLAIVKYVVELHSGTVSIDSELNVGTTFTVAIPRGQA
jgi:PAS domain S-box-containing protein